MKSIKFFLQLLIVNCTLLIGTASAQWWVDGGNLIWPYGDVTIKNDLNVNGDFFHSNDYVLSGLVYLNTNGSYVETSFFYNDLNLGIDSVKIEGSNGTDFRIVCYLNNCPANFTSLHTYERFVGRYMNDASSWRNGLFYLNFVVNKYKNALVIYGYDITYPGSRLFPPTFQTLDLSFDAHFRATKNIKDYTFEQ